MRIHVEQVFGFLVGRWVIYKCGIEMYLEFPLEVVESTMLLHQWLIDNVTLFEDEQSI